MVVVLKHLRYTSCVCVFVCVYGWGRLCDPNSWKKSTEYSKCLWNWDFPQVVSAPSAPFGPNVVFLNGLTWPDISGAYQTRAPFMRRSHWRLVLLHSICTSAPAYPKVCLIWLEKGHRINEGAQRDSKGRDDDVSLFAWIKNGSYAQVGEPYSRLPVNLAQIILINGLILAEDASWDCSEAASHALQIMDWLTSHQAVMPAHVDELQALHHSQEGPTPLTSPACSDGLYKLCNAA